MPSSRPIKRITLILLIVLMLPALVFSVFQISTLSESERLVSDMYRRQLDAVLFSVNQYALDVAHAWVSSVLQVIPGSSTTPSENGRAAIREWCGRTPSAIGVALTDSTLGSVSLVTGRNDQTTRVAGDLVLSSLRANREKVDRLKEYRRVGYRKLEPFQLAGGGDSAGAIVLVFSVGPEPSVQVAGLIIDEQAFIRDVLSRKLQDAGGEEFILGIMRERDGGLVTANSNVSVADFRQQKLIWVLPGYLLGIRLKGTTIEELVGGRVAKNIALVIILDVLLAAGIVVLYRSVRREMELARIKSDFVSNVSHELRTPLALIRMYAETLEMGRLKDDGKKAEYLSTILRESERLTRLVNNILDFSRMQAGKKQYRFAPVQINEVIRNVMQTYAVHLQTKGFTPVVELSDSLPAISGDAEALSEALINIIDNAVKYSEDERYLAVRSAPSGSGVCVEIEDHGIGIAPSDHAKIFDMFYRVSTGAVHDRKGTGIGLSLVHHIVHAHGGKVSVRSVPGKGSTFRLELPIRQQ